MENNNPLLNNQFNPFASITPSVSPENIKPFRGWRKSALEIMG